MFIGLPWSTMQKRKKIVFVLLMGMFMFLVGGIKNFPFFFPPSTLNTPLFPTKHVNKQNLCVGEERKIER